MLCDICHKNTATIHLTEIIEDKVTELHICQECASKKSKEGQNNIKLSAFFANISEEEQPSVDSVLRCDNCGMKFKEFRNNGRLGCAQCYNYFRGPLKVLIRKIHGFALHKGKIPASIGENVLLEKQLERLRSQLQRAIQLEAYEEAASLRDQIRSLEKKLYGKNE